MRTKTLLIAAAALAVGVISSEAQIYSQNVVGYVNTPLTNGVTAIIAPSLDLDGTGTNNTIATVVGTNGVPLNTAVYVFNGGNFETLTFAKSGHGTGTVTNWTLGITVTNNYPLNPGEGFFIAPAGNFTNLQVGTVLQGAITNQYVPAVGGVSALVASKIPLFGGVSTMLGYHATLGDSIYVFNNGAYTTYSFAKSGHGTSLATNWMNGLTISEPQFQVGQGFWLVPFASGTTWGTNFIVQ